MYNLVKRQAEVEILPMAEANGIGVIPYSPAAAGLLSGKYFGQASGRLKTNKMYEARYGDKWMFEVAEKYVGLLQAEGPASGQHGDRLGGRASRGHGAHHRRAQCRAAEGFTGRGEGRHDARAARRDRRPLAHAAAGHRSIGRAEGGEGRGVAATSSRKTPWSTMRHAFRDARTVAPYFWRCRRNADRSAGDSM